MGNQYNNKLPSEWRAAASLFYFVQKAAFTLQLADFGGVMADLAGGLFH